jgi:hypothetical protein
MTPERWQQVDKLLEQALGREPGRRGAFLDKACQGDAELRRRPAKQRLSLPPDLEERQPIDHQETRQDVNLSLRGL